MSTQVILLERVDSLGNMGDVVAVKPGYARNFLLPQKKALRASKENIAYFEAKKKQLEADNEKAKKEAEKTAKKLEGLKVPLVRQASESGHLYGSVTSRDIADQIVATSKIEVNRSMVKINQNFKFVGLFPVEVALHPEVIVEVIVNIARSAEEAEIQSETGKALVASAANAVEEEVQVQDEGALEGALEDSALEAKKEADAEAAIEAEAEAKKAAAKAEKAATKAAKAKKPAEDDAEATAEDAE